MSSEEVFLPIWCEDNRPVSLIESDLSSLVVVEICIYGDFASLLILMSDWNIAEVFLAVIGIGDGVLSATSGFSR